MRASAALVLAGLLAACSKTADKVTPEPSYAPESSGGAMVRKVPPSMTSTSAAPTVTPPPTHIPPPVT